MALLLFVPIRVAGGSTILHVLGIASSMPPMPFDLARRCWIGRPWSSVAPALCNRRAR
jgi:hypothetical protein